MPDTIYHIKITADISNMAAVAIMIHMVVEEAVEMVEDTEIVVMEDKMIAMATKIPDMIINPQ